MSDLVILYGSQTGTAQDISERIAREGVRRKLKVHLSSMDEFPFESFEENAVFCFVAATTGQGDEPNNMKTFWYNLRKKSTPLNLFQNTRFAVLGLGDSSYIKFNFIAKKLYKRIVQLGGIPLGDIGLADDQHDLGADAVIDPWITQFWSLAFPSLASINLPRELPPPKFNLITSTASKTYENGANICKNIPLEQRTLSSNERMTAKDHFQDVRLISFDLKGSELSYEPGDVLYVQPSNLDENVELFFQIFPNLNLIRNEDFYLESNHNHPWARIPNEILKILPLPWTWENTVRHYFDIQSIPRRYFFELLSFFTTSELEEEKLIEFTTPEGQQDLYSYCNRPKRNILEVLQDFPHSTKNIPSQYLFDLIPPIKPRAFSIASSLRSSPQTVQILVAVVNFQTKLKKPRKGLCSNWLARLNVGEVVPIWVEKGSFKFPNQKPIIMIGPGTGCAPFRSFISDRFDSPIDMLLFFGCRYQAKDYYFKEEWGRQMNENPKIQIITAFSRDKEEKDGRRTYVQHKITENGEFIWDLVEKKGGAILLAGNAKRMPIDVNEALQEVFKMAGCPDPGSYLNQLVKMNRFQTEVWS